MAKQAKGQKRPVAIEAQTAPASAATQYKVDLTHSAATVYADLYTRSKAAEGRGDEGNTVCTTFRMVQEAIKITIPRDPLNRSYALSGDLSNIFRLKKGRLRICWIASSKMRRVCVLFISETLRKAGDANDPYRVFAKMVMSGELDEFFAELGVRKPVL
jgi:mRNA-degrading endonuclease RelE of RelBE toxin-antitoxin system